MKAFYKGSGSSERLSSHCLSCLLENMGQLCPQAWMWPFPSCPLLVLATVNFPGSCKPLLPSIAALELSESYRQSINTDALALRT